MRAHVGEADPERCRDPAGPQDRAVRICHKGWTTKMVGVDVIQTRPALARRDDVCAIAIRGETCTARLSVAHDRLQTRDNLGQLRLSQHVRGQPRGHGSSAPRRRR